MGRIRKFILSALALALLLTGCSMPTLDELYCLPNRANTDSNLQEVIDEAMKGLQYSAPISGANQQTVQAADLDGDGKDEYLLFAKDNSEKPLKILIFSEIAVGYVLMDTIEGFGFAFEFVEYANVDDRPGLEIIVGRQVSDQVVRSVSVYRFTSGFSRQLMSSTYFRMATEDFDSNGQDELLLISPGQSDDSPAIATLYTYRNEEFFRSAEMELSVSADALKRVVLSTLSDGTYAVYASAALSEEQLITDVFIISNEQVMPVLMGFKTKILGNYYIYPEDIDGDGVMEMPSLEPMQVPADAKEQYYIDWHAVNANGEMTKKLSTYHNFMDGWYMRLSLDWAAQLAVLQTEDAYAFHLWNDNGSRTKELFSILILTGPDREEHAKLEGRYLLHRGETKIYVLELPEKSDLDVKELVSSFRLVRMDWNNEDNREEDNEKSSDS